VQDGCLARVLGVIEAGWGEESFEPDCHMLRFPGRCLISENTTNFICQPYSLDGNKAAILRNYKKPRALELAAKNPANS
jgi:hypothetical protein